MVEDSTYDAELLLQSLDRAGYELLYERVDNEQGMRKALADKSWDLVISDYVLPRFSGMDALRILKEMQIDIPFVVVSGKIGEEVAVEALKAGASDYLLKDRLTRLGTAVDRALAETAQRRRRQRRATTLRERPHVRVRDLHSRAPRPGPFRPPRFEYVRGGWRFRRQIPALR